MQFFHDQLMFVVRSRYHLDPPTYKNHHFCSIHNALTRFFAKKLINRDNDSFAHAVAVYPLHLQRAGPSSWTLLVDTLCSLPFLQLRCELKLLPLMTQDILDAIHCLQTYTGEGPEVISPVSLRADVERLGNTMLFVRKRMADLASFPTVVVQIAFNERPQSAPYLEAVRYFQKTNLQWIQDIPITPLDHIFQQINKPVDEGNNMGTLRGHYHYISDLDLDPSDTSLLSSSLDGTMKVWDLRTCSERALLKGHTGAVTCCQFMVSGKYVVSGGEDGTVRCWDSVTGLQLSSVAVCEGSSVTSLSVSEKSSSEDLSHLYVCVTCQAGIVTILLGKSLLEGSSVIVVAKSPFQCAAMDASLHPVPSTHKHCVCGYNNGDLILYDYSKPHDKVARKIAVRNTGAVVAAVVYIPHALKSYSGNVLAVGTYQKVIYILDSSDLNILQKVSGNFGWIYKLRVANNGIDLIVKHRSRSAALIGVFGAHATANPKTFTWTMYGTISGHQGYLSALALSSRTGLIVTGSEDKSIMLWRNPFLKDSSRSDIAARVRPEESIDLGQELSLIHI